MTTLPCAPSLRVTACNEAPLRPERGCVLYWMIGARRTRSSFALQHALARAAELARPLLVFEPLRVDYPHASERFHRFVLDGMRDNAARLAAAGVTWRGWLEPAPGAGRGLLAALAREAALVVTDEVPSTILPALVRAAARQLDVRLEQVDGNGLLPLRATAGEFATAHAFRRFLQRELGAHLECFPEAEPLDRVPAVARGAAWPARVQARWPALTPDTVRDPIALDALPIDAQVAASPALHGGERAASERLAGFVARRLARYAAERNHPDADAQSGLSPYLHFGHVGAHEVARCVLAHERWSPGRLGTRRDGRRVGWWGLGEDAEAFLDQLVTWRELGLVFAHHRPDALEDFAGLPLWAQRTLDAHRDDPRPVSYDLETLAAARTHDAVWNAAQHELVREGTLHNYLRMLWGKKILEWSASPEAALATLFALNDRFALDGRDASSSNGIGWVLGRFDRAWGPERPIFGTVRYMSSTSTRRKLRMADYLRRFG